MYTFQLLLLEENDKIMKLIDSVKMMDLAIALKYAETDVKDLFYANMPIYKIKILEDLMNELDSLDEEDSLKAQQAILQIFNKESHA